MSVDDLEKYEADMELALYKEYRDVLPMVRYVVETDRRFYLANNVDVRERDFGGRPFFEIELSDAWIWDMYRTQRFVQRVCVTTFRDFNIEERPIETPEPPEDLGGGTGGGNGPVG